MMKCIKIILGSLILIFILICCKSESKKRKSEKELISEYHLQVIKKKGDLIYFIPKNEVHWYFGNKEIVERENIMVGDNVSFFDEEGNIVYQATVDKINNDSIYIKCLDIKKIKYYVTNLSIDKIVDLNDSINYKIKFYR